MLAESSATGCIQNLLLHLSKDKIAIARLLLTLARLLNLARNQSQCPLLKMVSADKLQFSEDSPSKPLHLEYPCTDRASSKDK